MLVMLNGKRMNRSALGAGLSGRRDRTGLRFARPGPGLDSRRSPSSTLEILRDGASAQYGSDAIAGVLNYQFKTELTAPKSPAAIGEYFPKGYKRATAATGRSRSTSACRWAPRALRISAWNWPRTSRRCATRRALRPSRSPPTTRTSPRICRTTRVRCSSGARRRRRASRPFLNTGITLDNNDEVYFFMNWANIDTNESFNYRLPKTVTYQGTTYSNHPAFNNIYLDPCTAAYTGCPAGGYIQDATPSTSIPFTRRASRRASTARWSNSSAPWATRASIAGA